MPEIRNISFSYREYHKSEGSDIPYINLIEEAKKAAENAYAPYSGFRVGAAIMLESGRIIRGSNVENAAFPSGTCAETAALSYSVSNYPGDTPIAIAIAAMKGNSFTSVPVAPCGNCRQMIIEEEFRNKKKIKIIIYGEERILLIEDASSLLPLQFNQETLNPYPL